MNLVSSSGSNLVEDNDDDDAMDYQRHTLRAAVIGRENDRSRRDRIARLCTSSFASRAMVAFHVSVSSCTIQNLLRVQQ